MMQTNRGLRIAGIFVGLVLLGLFVVYNQTFSCWDFRNNLWGPTFLLTDGQSPYRVDALFDLGNAVWMPMVIGLFFPLGFLPLQQASNLWFIFNLIGILLIVWISSGSRRPSSTWLAVAILTTLLFPPMVTHLWSGQITVLIALVFIIAATFSEDIHPFFLAALIAIGLSKPQLSVLVVPGLLIHRIRVHGFSKTVGFGLLVILCMMIMTVPLFVAYPNWIPDFLFEVQQNPSWAHPSSLFFLSNTLPGIGPVLWAILFLILSVLNARLWINLPQQQAVFWSMAMTPLVTPYVWTWDFVMLLPLFVSALFKAGTKISLAVLLGGYVTCWSLITSFKLRGEVNDSLFWWIPWLFILFVVASTILLRGNNANPG